MTLLLIYFTSGFTQKVGIRSFDSLSKFYGVQYKESGEDSGKIVDLGSGVLKLCLGAIFGKSFNVAISFVNITYLLNNNEDCSTVLPSRITV